MAIKFGTDGWRGVIGEDYNLDNVRFCAQGAANYLKDRGLAPRGLVVGYDTRLRSEEFAAAVAEVSAANGITTMLGDKPAPTPAIAYNVVALDAGGGVIITASHNPAQWNGFKYKPDYGGSASPEVVEALEAHIAEVEASGQVERLGLGEAEAKGLLEYVDPEPRYLGHIATLVDLAAIRRSGLRVVVDSMFGAGAGYLAKLLSGGATVVDEIRAERDPSFPGMAQPEPIAQNLAPLAATVIEQEASVGLATDGDADRLGVVDERGHFVSTLHIFALLCFYQLEVLKRSGPLVRSVTMTSMVDRLGEIYDVPVTETPVGFKHLGPVMMAQDALMAGEESGGYAVRGSIPERDGILSGVMLLDLMVRTEKPLSELLDDLTAKVGPHHYDRWDLEFDPARRAAIQKRVTEAQPRTLAGRRVEAIDSKDGQKFVLEGGYWALVRFSGTEPLLRIYVEGTSLDEVEGLLSATRAIAGV